MALTDDILRLWPLSEHFEYAAELGLRLERDYPDLLSGTRDSQANRFSQARGFGVLMELERSVPKEMLLPMIEEALREGAPCEYEEITASLAQKGRRYPTPAETDPLPRLKKEKVTLFTHPSSLAYHGYGDTGTWTERALKPLQMETVFVEPATTKQLSRAHDERYLHELFALGRRGGGWLTPETAVLPASERAARVSAGATIQAALSALGGMPGALLAYARPGSHHASPVRAGGTCLINNLAVAAHAALDAGAFSVAILDLDAHHGNGTEACFEANRSVLTCSIHQASPFFPGTGGREREEGPSLLNLPVAAGESWYAAAEEALLKLQEFEPDLILVQLSADAHYADPASDLQAQDDDFEVISAELRKIAPVAFELGSSLSERAWNGVLRSTVRGAQRPRRLLPSRS